MIIGGVARSVWASPRATQDLDVIYSGPLPEAVAAAPHIGHVALPNEVAALADALMTRLRLPQRLTGPVRMDVIAASHPYYDRLIARSRRLGQGGLRVAAPEDIILLKLIADRPQDRADVRAIIAAQGGLLDRALLAEEAATQELVLPDDLETPTI